MYVHMYVCVCVCVRVCMYRCIYAIMHVCMWLTNNHCNLYDHHHHQHHCCCHLLIIIIIIVVITIIIIMRLLLLLLGPSEDSMLCTARTSTSFFTGAGTAEYGLSMVKRALAESGVTMQLESISMCVMHLAHWQQLRQVESNSISSTMMPTSHRLVSSH